MWDTQGRREEGFANRRPGGWNVFRGPGGRRHRREARLGCRQNFWPRARRDERRRPGIRSRASFRSSRRFGNPKSCSGSLGSGSRRTAACAWLALAQRGRNSKHSVWRRSGALGVVGFAADARSSCSAPETRTLKEERECTTSIQHKARTEPTGLEAPEPESFEYNFEQEQEIDFETGSPFGEIEETELAEGLLAVQS